MSGIKGQVMIVMELTHLLDKIGKENIYAGTEDAVATFVEKVHENKDLPQESQVLYIQSILLILVHLDQGLIKLKI